MNIMSYLKAVLFSVLLILPVAGYSEQTVNINTATAEQLASTLLGVGDSKAKAIVAYRDRHGPFAAADDLVMVKGIGTATVSKNRDLISVEVAQ